MPSSPRIAPRPCSFAAVLLGALACWSPAAEGPADLPAPPEAGAVWDLADAARAATATRERVCLNGLWAFIPAAAGEQPAPPPAGSGWGWAKVPGLWPAAKGGGDWMFAGDAQELLLPAGAAIPADGLVRAWYRRTVAVPPAWAGRSLVLDCAMISTSARVRWAGAEAGVLRWPGGTLALGEARPGEHALELLVDAGASFETIDTGLYTGKRSTRMARLRGPCGDFQLEAVPAARIAALRAEPSVRANRLTLLATVAGAPAGARVAARITGPDGALLLELPAQAVADGAVRWQADAARLPRWDLHTPGNRLGAVAVLSDAEGRVLDQSLPLEFGFRELWAEGRDLVLNGIPFHGRVLQIASHTLPADRASPAAVERTLRLAKDWGFNAVWPIREYEPGEWSGLDALLDAADRIGLVVSLPTPHPKLLDWNRRDAALQEWTRTAAALVERVHRHPSAVMYGMSFNYGWYYGHEDPRFMDGSWLPDAMAENVANGHRAAMGLTEEALRRLDPTRWIYHHHSGSYGNAHTDCIYLNWAPVQERSEWPWQWSQRGSKPLMFVEWGLPHFASWSNYRGPAHLHGYMGPQWLLTAEYNAPFLGQEAYRPQANREQLLRDTQNLLVAGKPFHNAALIQSGWGFDLATRKPAANGWIYREELPVQALYAAENWRAHRAFGLSWTLPWDQQGFAQPLADAPLGLLPEPARWQGLKRPGLSPDRTVHRYPTGGDIFHSPVPERWAPTVLGREVLRWNRPLAAWIGGGPGPDEVAASHRTWTAGETARHQLVVVNDQRTARTVAWRWALEGTALAGAGELTVAPGGQQRVPLELALPAGLAA
ncbi:MAG: hypothetical protein L6R48_07865, partial [Planctomycetes bacterium]|nr:hypothetical protein [Planctomycetota bacterium]